MSFTDNDMCDQVAVIAYDLDSALNTVPSCLQTLLEQNYPLAMLKEEKIKELVTKYVHCPQVGKLARRMLCKTTGSSSRLPTVHLTSVQHEKNFVRRVMSSESRTAVLPKRTDLAPNSKKTSSDSLPSDDELMGLIASKRTNPAKFVPKSKTVLTNSSTNFKNIQTSTKTKKSPELKKAENDRMGRMMMERREVKKEAEKKAEEGVKSVKQMLNEVYYFLQVLRFNCIVLFVSTLFQYFSWADIKPMSYSDIPS
ncbi:hypothetical protein L3Y34_003759 [Caenorhabditis briggsae]|uniref:Uncharacterized protein n=1 Tax=Caenorhabditis briggsae TaxID=6238 RepID=A0AAE9AA85_CAEBR|nr:hypothetical protein L3Y34_003759 [Caenorhabditis briggsae]